MMKMSAPNATVGYHEAIEIAAKYNKTLLAGAFENSVRIVHTDGSSFFFDSAFLMRIDEWIVCFTEHHQVSIYHETDLVLYSQYKLIDNIGELDHD